MDQHVRFLREFDGRGGFINSDPLAPDPHPDMQPSRESSEAFTGRFSYTHGPLPTTPTRPGRQSDSLPPSSPFVDSPERPIPSSPGPTFNASHNPEDESAESSSDSDSDSDHFSVSASLPPRDIYTIHGPALPSDPDDAIFDDWGGFLAHEHAIPTSDDENLEIPDLENDSNVDSGIFGVGNTAGDISETLPDGSPIKLSSIDVDWSDPLEESSSVASGQGLCHFRDHFSMLFSTSMFRIYDE